MEQFVSWLYCWNQDNVQHDSGVLSKETYQTLTHTVCILVILIRELLQHNVLKSILTGKFQTDQLESRFGYYRQLSGSNYLVTVSDVSCSKKKLKVKRLLKLYYGYVERKTMCKTEYSSCKAMFRSLEKPFILDINPEHFTYFDSINRGGLMFSSYFIFNILLCGYCIFNLCISKELQSIFLAL